VESRPHAPRREELHRHAPQYEEPHRHAPPQGLVPRWALLSIA